MSVFGWILSKVFGLNDDFDDGQDSCLHGNVEAICGVLCADCGHACKLHVADCREVVQKGPRTSEWYCQCKQFKG